MPYPLVLLHGLGQTADAWDSVVAALPPEWDIRCVSLFASAPDIPCTLSALLSRLTDVLAEEKGPVHLCGLSLGAVLALEYAAAHPEKTASMTLIAPQYKPPRGLMRVQNILFRCMPERSFASVGLSKRDCLTLMDSMAELDLTPVLPTLHIPTRILCGEKDKANISAAHTAASLLPAAELHFVQGCGHEMNREAPEKLAALLRDYIMK